MNKTVDLSRFAAAEPFWEKWGFVPWDSQNMGGVYRRITMHKDAILGEIASYSADDYVVWTYDEETAAETLLRTAKPQADVMMQRFVLVTEAPLRRPTRRGRSFWFGLRGFAEVYRYRPHAKPLRGLEDLAVLIDKAWERSAGKSL